MKSLEFDEEYTAIGQFNNNTIATSIKIPLEDPGNPYEITTYNATKLYGSVKINAIYCHLRLNHDNGGILHSSDFNHTIQIDSANLTPISNQGNNVDFDPKLNTTLIIVFHEDHNNSNDRNVIFSNIEFYAAKAEKEGNFTDYLPNVASEAKSKGVPRVLGVSIIRR
ncbi:MAG: hypothetical protein EOO46_01610 [Flavobacterium sp.]|nr:MAG: hypothetical protein EOO46_01610 [Flavobacterium sp.]